MQRASEKQSTKNKTNLRELKNILTNNYPEASLFVPETNMTSHHCQQLHNPESGLARR